MKRIPPIILAPLIAHPLWAVLMMTAPIPLHTVGIDAIYTVAPGPMSAALLMFLSSASAWAAHSDRLHGHPVGFMLMMPQQFLILLSLWTVGVAVARATYANGYAPPEGWRFIAADQIFFATCSILHTVALYKQYIKRPVA